MGLSRDSTGAGSVDAGLLLQKRSESDRVVALAGNPNVGKSTLFNGLTGMKQHTGNWPGKTIASAQGYCVHREKGYVLVDIPGCYSLMAHSAEEEVARDFICFGEPDAVVVVCDAVCLERNMNLALQVMEAAPRVVLCVNLMDEAKKKGIRVDLEGLERELGIPVVGTAARSGSGLTRLLDRLEETLQGGEEPQAVEEPRAAATVCPVPVLYPDYVEEAIGRLRGAGLPRWACARLLDGGGDFGERLIQAFEGEIPVSGILDGIRRELDERGITAQRMSDDMAGAFVGRAEEVCRGKIRFDREGYDRKDRLLDRLFTSRLTGFPIMFLILLLIFWITVTGANYPSQILSEALFALEERLMELFSLSGLPGWVGEMLVHGVYRVLAWVVSVMLPPMAIFFPLFTLLEDSGYLPRIAFNLDRCFQKCHACGKQALTMCMGPRRMRRNL